VAGAVAPELVRVTCYLAAHRMARTQRAIVEWAPVGMVTRGALGVDSLEWRRPSGAIAPHRYDIIIRLIDAGAIGLELMHLELRPTVYGAVANIGPVNGNTT